MPITTTTARDSFHSTSDPLADPSSIDLVKQMRKTYNDLLGMPTPANIATLVPSRQAIIPKLTSTIPLLPSEERSSRRLSINS